jgi:hypothetical protein
MSSSASVYVGPYAVWAGEGGFPRQDGELVTFETLGDYFGEDGTAEVEYDQGDVKTVIYVPNDDRPGGPRRTVSYGSYPPGGCAALDLRGIDPDAEVAAFRKAYAKELAELTAAAGREPMYRWGLVYCIS